MPHLRFLRRRSRRVQHAVCLWHVWIGCALLLSGCSKSDPAEMDRLYREWNQFNQSSTGTFESTEGWALAPHAEQLPATEQIAVVVDPPQLVEPSQYWEFSDDTRLVCLPDVGEDSESDEPSAEAKPLGNLCAPLVSVPATAVTPGADAYGSPAAPELPELELPMPEPVVEEFAVKRSRAIQVPAIKELSTEEHRLLDLIERETLSATTGVPTDAKLDQQCREKIGAAFALSQRGASYAARQELIAVLRLISQAKDNREGTRTRTESLAAGLRALEEAEDFAPRGSQLEAEMALRVVCAAHRTPLARELDLAAMLPSQIMERYNRYAQIKLAHAVAGEPAGSMALYALGKLCSQLGAIEPEQHPLATRKAVAYQQASLLAHNENYMAAHELGVLLAETGHFPEAQHLLTQVAAEQPNAVVYRNLARVQDALGQTDEAQFSRNEGQRLAQQGRGPKPNIAWVSPQEFSRGQTNTFTPQVANRVAAPTQSAPAVMWR